MLVRAKGSQMLGSPEAAAGGSHCASVRSTFGQLLHRCMNHQFVKEVRDVSEEEVDEHVRIDVDSTRQNAPNSPGMKPTESVHGVEDLLFIFRRNANEALLLSHTLLHGDAPQPRTVHRIPQRPQDRQRAHARALRSYDVGQRRKDAAHLCDPALLLPCCAILTASREPECSVRNTGGRVDSAHQVDEDVIEPRKYLASRVVVLRLIECHVQSITSLECALRTLKN
jgi:hypothetical protein